MLAVRCQFLQGTYQAAEPGRLGDAEWPPHPARLHAALVAAGWALGGETFPEQALEALRWLERQDPPDVTEPTHVGQRTTATVYVPRNLSPREVTSVRGHLRAGRATAASRESGRVDRVFPTSVPGDEPVWLVWPDADPPPEVRAALDRLLAEVPYLGSSRSPVTCALDESAPDASLVPVAGAGLMALRVGYPGLTDALVGARGEESRRHLRPTAAYGRPGTPPEPEHRSPFATLVVLRRRTGFELSVQHAALLTRALRRAVLAQAGDDAPEALHGHGRHPHAAFLALPNAGHRHSNGEILGMAVAIPAEAKDSDRDAIVTATRAIGRLALKAGIEPWTLEPAGGELERRTLDPARWIGPAERWRTVTPMVLDRHPKRGETLEEMVRRSFTNALLPEPVELRASPVPFLGGAVPAVMHRRRGEPAGLMVHVEATFALALRGPAIVGRGRYMGLGLLAPSGRPGRAS